MQAVSRRKPAAAVRLSVCGGRAVQASMWFGARKRKRTRKDDAEKTKQTLPDVNAGGGFNEHQSWRVPQAHKAADGIRHSAT